jgi:type I site-specific restriction endonuclease
MTLNEADTRAQLIDPQLNRAGWTRSSAFCVARPHLAAGD